MFFRTSQAASPLYPVLLELVAKSEALTTAVQEKNERALLLARCGAVRRLSGDSAGASARTHDVQALLGNLSTNEDGALDHTKLAVALAKAGDSEGAAAQFAALRKSAEGGTLESLKLGSLRELATAYHEAGDDKTALALLKQVAPEIKRVDGADSSGFALALYSLAEFGAPDTAEQLAPQLKLATNRAVTLRKVALALKASNLPRAKTVMQRAVALTLADKAKTPGLLHGHIGALVALGMRAEAQALTTKLPALFPKKSDQEELALMLPTCYGALGQFPKAIALAEKLPGKKQNAKLTELIDLAIEQKNTPVFEQLLQKLAARAAKDPERKKDPMGETGLTLLFNMIRLGALLRQDKYPEAVPLLRSTMATAEKLPITEPREKADLPLGLAELVAELLEKKG